MKAAWAGESPPTLVFEIWRDSQVVRQRSAKPLFTSSNLVHASKRKTPETRCFRGFALQIIAGRTAALPRPCIATDRKSPRYSHLGAVCSAAGRSVANATKIRANNSVKKSFIPKLLEKMIAYLMRQAKQRKDFLNGTDEADAQETLPLDIPGREGTGEIDPSLPAKSGLSVHQTESIIDVPHAALPMRAASTGSARYNSSYSLTASPPL